MTRRFLDFLQLKRSLIGLNVLFSSFVYHVKASYFCHIRKLLHEGVSDGHLCPPSF